MSFSPIWGCLWPNFVFGHRYLRYLRLLQIPQTNKGILTDSCSHGRTQTDKHRLMYILKAYYQEQIKKRTWNVKVGNLVFLGINVHVCHVKSHLHHRCALNWTLGMQLVCFLSVTQQRGESCGTVLYREQISSSFVICSCCYAIDGTH